MLNFIYAECHIQALYAECHYAEWHHPEWHYAECHGVNRAKFSTLEMAAYELFGNCFTKQNGLT